MGAPEFTSNLEPRIVEIGARLHQRAAHAKPSLFSGRGLSGKLAARALHDEALRTALFRFVDTLPQLDTSEELARHFRSYLHTHELGGLWGRLLRLGNYPLLAPAVRASVQRLAREFLVAENARSVNRVLSTVNRIPATATFDAVGEAVLTEAEADHYMQRNLRLLEWLASASGAVPAISVKLSALTPRFDSIDPAGSTTRALARLQPILARAVELNAAVTVDMEQHELKGMIVDAFLQMLDAFPQSGWMPGIALQAYAPDTLAILERVIRRVRERERRICVRLVKGAYWDTEVALAEQRNWPAPVFTDKAHTDQQYEALTALLFDNADVIYPAIAGHNLRSLSHAIAAAEVRGLGADRWEVQMLLGMANPLAEAIAAAGVKLRMYIPMGDLLAGIAYLIRRLMENTANNSILRQTYVEAQDVRLLLAAPQPIVAESKPALSGFQSTPLLDFSRPDIQQSFRESLNQVAADLGKRWPLQIDGVPHTNMQVQKCINPAQPEQVLGLVELGEVAHAEQAVANAAHAFEAWRETPAERRAQLCLRAADLMQERRQRLAALEVFEVGKNWREADADVAEAIDYLRFYAQQMLSLAGDHPTICYPGETNHLTYEARGVAVIIAPWNFPLAILTGMTSAALVAGNPAIMKPAGPSTLIALQLVELLREAGFPPGVCQIIPGNGPEVGAFLVDHPKVAIIAFTGSREVGLSILQRAAVVHPGQREVKRVVCEMGGKNAIIIDRDADLDEAVLHTLLSAFGYQGQKCSAASRAIVVGDLHQRFADRLAEALDCYTYGAPEDPSHVFGPVITAAAKTRIEGYVEVGRAEGRLLYRGKVPDQGFYVAPTIFTAIEPQHRLAREEIFGPVLSVMRARNFEDALQMALDSDFALTGGLFSRLPEHIELARRRYRVGNLYINRKITGATVGAQPFGGMRMSGTGVQAGGPDYLKQFMWTRVVTENTLRHGFVPPHSAL
jgi:RHH-type proline utilization regulon transcriptional repressor/proline dehydrogenase/delta 1-pyrroline-5-carboxylate dehydrogenase